MKKGSLVALISILIFTVARAEDVRLANGNVLRNVTVEWSDSAGVAIRPRTFAASTTKYPWAWIHPEDAARIKDLHQKASERATQVAAVEKTALEGFVKVIQVLPTGVLAKIITAQKPSAPDAGFLTETDDITIYIAETPSLSLVDGKLIKGKFYPCGRHQYDSVLGSQKTVRRFATTAERALELLAEK